MAVLVEAFSVIVRRDAVNTRFAGGMSAFLETFPNQSACHDADLFRVGFMDSADARAYVESLEASGLNFHRNAVTIDLATVLCKQKERSEQMEPDRRHLLEPIAPPSNQPKSTLVHPGL